MADHMSSNAYSSSTPRRTSAQAPPVLPQLLVDEPDVYGLSSSLSAGAAYTNYTTGSMFPPQHPNRSSLSPMIPSYATYPPVSPQDPMRRWYGQRSEEPWNPSRPATNQVHPSPYNGPSFTNARSKAGSDTESIITTHNTPPTAPSVYSNTDDPMTGYQDPLQIQPEMASMDLTLGTTISRTSSQLDVPSTAQRSGVAQKKKPPFRCKYCPAVCKTQSELKKHRLKHERPFKCPVVTCERSNGGFTTSNDLERHKRSKHKIFEGDDVKVWKCASSSCSEKPKLWYRLDNFCQHLDRMHQREDKEDLIKRSEMRIKAGSYPDVTDPIEQGDDTNETMAVVAIADDFAHIGSFQPIDQFNYQDAMGQPTELDLPMSVSNTSDELSQTNSGTWSVPPYAMSQPSTDGLSTYSNSFEALPKRKANVIVHPPATSIDGHVLATDWIEGALAGGCDLMSLMDTIKSKMHVDASQNAMYGPLYGKYYTGNNITAYPMDPPKGLKSLQSKGSISKNTRRSSVASSQNQFKTPHESYSTVSEDRLLRCKHCGKELPRLSALKKHQKRHERAYGCTFESCNKTFGSKDDWKRHENSQHFQVDTWRCGEILKVVDYSGASEKPCAKLFHRKEIFSEHLKRTHAITDKTRIIEECNKRHVGCNSQGSYWCGFCCEIKELNASGGKAWDERFNHIGDHFGEGFNITQWLPQGQGPFIPIQRGEPQDDVSEDLDDEKYDENNELGAPPSPPSAQPMDTPSFVNPFEININLTQSVDHGCMPSAHKRARIDPPSTLQHYQQSSHDIIDETGQGSANNSFYSINYPMSSTLDPRALYAPLYHHQN